MQCRSAALNIHVDGVRQLRGKQPGGPTVQLICDAVTVLGSRHGLLLNPVENCCELVRFEPFTEQKQFDVRAGIRIGNRERVFPFCDDRDCHFTFVEQRLTPCTLRYIAIDPGTGLKVHLTLVTPFRPRDARFSTTPVLGIKLDVERLNGSFRWTPPSIGVDEVQLFAEFGKAPFSLEPTTDSRLDLTFASEPVANSEQKTFEGERSRVPQRDCIVTTDGQRRGNAFHRLVDPDDEADRSLDLYWCTYSEPVLTIQGIPSPFKYTDRFTSLNEVADWAARSGAELWTNADHVDGIVGAHECDRSVDRLLAQTLHAWLANTWWTKRDDRDWFSVWEGSCYFHSTVDVEFTQAPFYLSVWPELLALQLDAWPEFSKDGTRILGKAGEGTTYLSHDVGRDCAIDGMMYHHDMPVEETTNWIVLAYCHWRRSGSDAIIVRRAEVLRSYLRFLIACDTTGNGVPDAGMANTIDDACPAIQFGREQVYLAVKTLAAFKTGSGMLRHLGHRREADELKTRCEQLREAVESKGWQEDHYAVLLQRDGILKHPWKDEDLAFDEIPGWNAAHIYTENVLPVLDMVGMDLGLNPDHVRRDLHTAARRCLHEYGCRHTDYNPAADADSGVLSGLVGDARNCGWISMNMLRDMAAFYRGVDLRFLSSRYWEWQTTTNAAQPMLFFETFAGNNLCFYPRGVAVWGYFEALEGLSIDWVEERLHVAHPLPNVSVPRLFDSVWAPEPDDAG